MLYTLAECADSREESSNLSTSQSYSTLSLQLEEASLNESRQSMFTTKNDLGQKPPSKPTSGYSRMENEINLMHLIKLMQTFHVSFSGTTWADLGCFFRALKKIKGGGGGGGR